MFQVPNTEEQWRETQNKFHHKWNFPQCLGALDGKHVRIQCPRNGGSLYYNYCGFHSIVLFALVDATYRFLYYEVGAQERVGYATIWNASNLKRDLELENGRLNTPPALATPQTNIPIPSLIVADSAFALSPKLMKPHPERGTDHEKVFNYRLSRARRIVENAFGILACRFGVYQSAIRVAPKKTKKIVLATLAPHNFLRDVKDQQYCGPGAVDYEQGPNRQVMPGDWRNNRNANLFGLQAVNGGAHIQHAPGTQVRDALREFFNGQGAVPWQNARA